MILYYKNILFQVLKALAMVRLMKTQEALALLDEVKSHFPLDESTLQAMSVCYKELLQRKNLFYVFHRTEKLCF